MLYVSPFLHDDVKLLLSDYEDDEDEFDDSGVEGDHGPQQLSVLWEERLKEELSKTSPLEDVCAALREDLDAAHRQRMEAFEVKMKPIIIRDGPSRKANYKIQAARLHYDIYALTQRLRVTTMRAEHEEQRRERREREVRRLREEISEKKTAVTTVTKGIPFNKIEVRPDDQLPPHSVHALGYYVPAGFAWGAAAAAAGASSTLFGSSPPKPSFALPLPPFSRGQVMATTSVAAGALSATTRPFGFSGLASLPQIPNGPQQGLQNYDLGGGANGQQPVNPKTLSNGRIPGGYQQTFS